MSVEIIKNPGLVIPDHVRRQIEERKATAKADLHVVDMVVNVSAPLPGRIEDWPAKIQDAIYEALMRKCVEEGRTYTIVNSRCGIDDGVPYLHVVAAWKRGMDEETRH